MTQLDPKEVEKKVFVMGNVVAEQVNKGENVIVMGSGMEVVQKEVEKQVFIMGSGMEVVEKQVIVMGSGTDSGTLPEVEMEFDITLEKEDKESLKEVKKEPEFTFIEKDSEPDLVESSDEEEKADIVSPLTVSKKDISEAEMNFDKNLELRVEHKFSILQRERKSTLRGNRESELRGSKVNELIFRASNFMKLNQQRSTLIKSTSNQTNFDYKHLRF